jgi:hypothetical protein
MATEKGPPLVEKGTPTDATDAGDSALPTIQDPGHVTDHVTREATPEDDEVQLIENPAKRVFEDISGATFEENLRGPKRSFTAKAKKASIAEQQAGKALALLVAAAKNDIKYLKGVKLLTKLIEGTPTKSKTDKALEKILEKLETLEAPINERPKETALAATIPATKTLAATTSQTIKGLKNSTWAKVASQGLVPAVTAATTEAPWTLISKKKGLQKKEAKSVIQGNNAQEQVVVLLQKDSPFPGSPKSVRDSLNQLLGSTLVSRAEKSQKGNLVITMRTGEKAGTLWGKRETWKQALSGFQIKDIIRPESWVRLLAHKVPATFEDLKTLDSEILTYNKVKSVGTTRWLRQPKGRHGSVILTVPSLEIAKKLQEKGLEIGGQRIKVEAFKDFTNKTQCPSCYGFGHNPKTCKQIRCQFCGENHLSKDHACKSCQVKGAPCQHVTFKCCNCKGAHKASDPTCEARKAVKTPFRREKEWGKAPITEETSWN